MTRQILLRATKDPFEVVSAETTLAQDLIGNNSGNLIFIEATHKILGTHDVSIAPDLFRAHLLGGDRINERFDVYVVPLANAFRLGFERHLVAMTRLIERLRIPVVVLGVGAQAPMRYDSARLRPIEGSVRAFMRAVLDRSPSVGVRGEFTYDYLRGLGFRDVDVIGCPSMFLHGDRMPVVKRVDALTEESLVAVNVSPYVKSMRPILMSALEQYPNLRYIAQDLDTLALLLWGDLRPSPDPQLLKPIHSSHPVFQQRKVRFFVDPWPWIEDLRAADFSFGTRIHGNIAALLAGTPAVVLAHDSRTLELARYFAIPHHRISHVPTDIDAAALYEAADFTELINGHGGRFQTFTDFLARHDLRHVFLAGEDPGAFDRRMSETAFPPAVEYVAAARVGQVRRRARRLRGQLQQKVRRRAVLKS